MSSAIGTSKPTTMTGYTTVQLGDLVVAVFDEAACYSAYPRAVSLLATRAIQHMLWRARRTSRNARRPSGVAVGGIS